MSRFCRCSGGGGGGEGCTEVEKYRQQISKAKPHILSKSKSSLAGQLFQYFIFCFHKIFPISVWDLGQFFFKGALKPIFSNGDFFFLFSSKWLYLLRWKRQLDRTSQGLTWLGLSVTKLHCDHKTINGRRPVLGRIGFGEERTDSEHGHSNSCPSWRTIKVRGKERDTGCLSSAGGRWLSCRLQQGVVRSCVVPFCKLISRGGSRQDVSCGCGVKAELGNCLWAWGRLKVCHVNQKIGCCPQRTSGNFADINLAEKCVQRIQNAAGTTKRYTEWELPLSKNGKRMKIKQISIAI